MTRYVIFLVSFFLSACASNPRLVQESLPTRIVKTDRFLLVPYIKSMVAMNGEVRELNKKFGLDFENEVVAKLRKNNVYARVAEPMERGLPDDALSISKLLQSYASPSNCIGTISFETCKRNIPPVAIVVEPAKIVVNAPSNFSAYFKVTLIEIESGEKLWTGIFSVSRILEKSAHSEAASDLANLVAEKIRASGFAIMSNKYGDFYY